MPSADRSEPRPVGARRAPRWSALGRALVAVAVVAVGCGGDGPPEGRVIQLLPTSAPAGSWEWTGDCRVGPRAGAGCDPAGPLIGNAQLTGNTWNLGAADNATGGVRMAITRAGGLEVRGDLSSAPPCTTATCVAPEANTWVRGFPSVLYGIDQCLAPTSPPQSRDLPLPRSVRSLAPGLEGITTYDTRAPGVTYTVAYDLWLNPTDTTTPCRTNGTLEVMVWTDYDNPALLPDSLRVGTATFPYAVDGRPDRGVDAWRIYAANVFEAGRTEPWGGTVWLVLDPARRVPSGRVAVDLYTALEAVGGLLENNYRWRDFATSYYLNTIAFGIEFGPADASLAGGGPAPFAFDLSAYCLVAGSGSLATAC